MPAVIDTGGPRVLHCVERAVCPIIPTASTIPRSSFSSSGYPPSYPIQRQTQQSRFSVDRLVHRCNVNIPDTLNRSSIADTRFIPGNDERDEFFTVERSPPSTTSSNDLGCLVVPLTERNNNCAKDRKRYDALRRCRVNRKNRRFIKIQRSTEYVSSECANEHVPELINESMEECQERLSSKNCHVDNNETGIINDRQRTSTKHHEKESDGSSTTSPCHLSRVSIRENNTDEDERSSDIVMRLFGGCYVKKQEYQLTCPRMKEINDAQSAAISSQGVSNCVEYEWSCECECFARISRDDLVGTTRAESENVRMMRERRKNRHKSYIQNKGRSYMQLALLIFFVAFGHGSLSKSNFASFGGKSGNIGAGLGVFTIGTIVGSVRAIPVDFDAGVRAERSANLSHITGASRKIQMYIKNRHLQILPDGTVNGSNDDTSEYTIFQRSSVSRGQLRIQGVATCLYLCMDSCGLLYGSRESTEDCVFNETLEQHNYNTYSSVRWSTPKKSLYLGLNRRGQPRRVQAKGHNLGRLSAYARVLTQVASPERVEALQARMLGPHHNVRHHHKTHHHHRNIQHQQQQQQQQQQQPLCPNLPPQEKDGRDKFRCRKRKKRKKRKRQCNEGEKPGPHCEFIELSSHSGKSSNTSESMVPQSKRSCEGAASEELCRKQALDAPAKKRKSRIEGPKRNVGGRENQRQKEAQKKKEMRAKKSAAGQADEDEASSAGILADGIESVKKKRPGTTKPKASSAGMRKKINGRVSRTTVTVDSTILGMTLPSSWFPGASTNPTTESSTWRRTSKNPQGSAQQNAVTSVSFKPMRIGKSLDGEAQLGAPESSTLETITDGNFEEISSIFYHTNDSSIETSDETKSDESLGQDDDVTIPMIEYSTLMTTMDTTPPERTEDYTRATTQSIPSSIENSHENTDMIDDSTRLKRTMKFGRDIRSSLERLAM